MPNAPDLKVLENYGAYKQIFNVNELINESVKQHNLALHCAAWRGLLRYYHHYILFISNVSENIINIRIIEKSTKNLSQLVPVGLCLRGFCLREFCSINQKIKLFGFDKGLFILGDYSREQRLNAEKQASESCGKEDYYSMKNSNCEHFVNFCFTSKPISYQSELNKGKANLGDVTIDAASYLTRSFIFNKPLLVAIVIDGAFLTRECLQMKKQLDKKEISTKIRHRFSRWLI